MIEQTVKKNLVLPNGPSESNGWVFRAPGEIERVEAFFHGRAFEPHRHDTYAIGLTLAGVQSFDYRGCSRFSLPGQTVVMHPDEKHDGRAGADDGFRYRVIYLEPALIQSALGGKPLPFVEGGHSSCPQLQKAASALLGDYDRPLEPLEYQDAIYDLAHALDGGAGKASTTRKRFDYRAAETARRYIIERLDQDLSLDDLERVTQRNRWKLSRDFRTLYGTSPYRYLIMRRLEKARALMLTGTPLVEAAHEAHFADQSHMTRNFKKTYGSTPKLWLTSQIHLEPTRTGQVD